MNDAPWRDDITSPEVAAAIHVVGWVDEMWHIISQYDRTGRITTVSLSYRRWRECGQPRTILGYPVTVNQAAHAPDMSITVEPVATTTEEAD